MSVPGNFLPALKHHWEVFRCVFRLLHYNQVGRIIVALVAVNVMHDFTGEQVASEHGFRYHAVFVTTTELPI